MNILYPLRFRPILKQYIWGGHRLGTLLGKKIGPESNYAESWEVSDHGQNQSVVAVGPLVGATLAGLVADHGGELLGRHHPQARFPLIMKFLDANQTTSLQVHPDDNRAAMLDPPDLGKSEAWVVLDAEPGSTICAGLKPGTGRNAFAESLREGACREVLHRFQPEVGDCIFIPAGTVHALGAGLLVAEIQQASDVTYRLFDWDRLDAAGQPRPLQIEQGLAAIDFDRAPGRPQRPLPTDRSTVGRLVECDKFVLDRWEFATAQPAGGDRKCHIISVLEGAVRVEGDLSDEVLPRGGTVLLPAVLGEVSLTPHGQTVLLDAYLP